MFRTLIMVAALSLAACNQPPPTTGGSIPPPTSILPAPADVANRTAADEAVYVGGERLYMITRTAGEKLVDLGVIKGRTAVTLAAIDDKLYAGLQALRVAYATANSTNLLAASANLVDLARQVEALIKGDTR